MAPGWERLEKYKWWRIYLRYKRIVSVCSLLNEDGRIYMS
jgi:hypothetical protein